MIIPGITFHLSNGDKPPPRGDNGNMRMSRSQARTLADFDRE